MREFAKRRGGKAPGTRGPEVSLAAVAVLLAFAPHCGPGSPSPGDAATDAPRTDILTDAGDVFETISSDCGTADAAYALPPAPDCGAAMACGGDCVDLATDVHHCGACSTDCTQLTGVNPGAVTCVQSVCVLTAACAPGRAHCSADPSAGCETDLSNKASCGACASVCPLDMPACSAGADGLYRCAVACDGSTPTACDGRCVDTVSDVEHCGGCAPCPDIARGVSVCSLGTCSVRCDDGTTLRGSECVPLWPRPLYPATTARVYTRRPTLRWVPGEPADGTRVELCRDRACTALIESFDATGGAGRPTMDLPRGVAFWRLRTLGPGGAVGTVASPTWEMFIAPSAVEVDVGWGAATDFNGDGLADLYQIVGTRGNNSVTVHFGRPWGIDASANDALLVQVPIADSTIGSDVDGDGFLDVVFTDRADPPAMYVIHGGPQGLLQRPLERVATDGIHAPWPVAIGDFDGDGYGDVAVNDWMPPQLPNDLKIYLGGPDGLRATRVRTIETPRLGVISRTTISYLGDVDADGFADVLAMQTSDPQTGAAFVLYGSADLAGTRWWGPLPTNPGLNWTRSPRAVGDLNGDGAADLAADSYGGYPWEIGADVYYGTPGGGPPRFMRRELYLSQGSADGFERGDIDGDGYDDLFSSLDPLRVFCGTPSGLATDGVVLPLDAPPSPRTVFSLGDVNGDGYDDVSVSGDSQSIYFGGPDLLTARRRQTFIP